jgi:hypothetical protein
VYVFVRSARGAWTQQAYIKSSNTNPFDYFGFSVALSGDTLAVSAMAEDGGLGGINVGDGDNAAGGAGAVYDFTRSAAGVWSQRAYIKASNAQQGDTFGQSVALNDGMLAVGAYREASAAKGINGNQADNNATQAGAAYVFE